ncbi:MAG TPA: hypothetical protein PLZ55_03740 [bacterium]|mgnify:FL=1|nr:hypothetical protein [bacterium]
MTTTILLTRNDHGIQLRFTCQDHEGNPIDLTDREVHFLLESDGEILNADRSLCENIDSPAGKAAYTVDAADRAQVGILKGRLRLQSESLQVENLEPIAVRVKE